jgi:hypothetical protein
MSRHLAFRLRQFDPPFGECADARAARPFSSEQKPVAPARGFSLSLTVTDRQPNPGGRLVPCSPGRMGGSRGAAEKGRMPVAVLRFNPATIVADRLYG